jgi:hypothetical protein
MDEAGAGKSIDGPRLVMVLQIKSVPAAIRVHEDLPFGHYSLELVQAPGTGREFSIGAMIYVHAAEVSA